MRLEALRARKKLSHTKEYAIFDAFTSFIIIIISLWNMYSNIWCEAMLQHADVYIFRIF